MAALIALLWERWRLTRWYIVAAVMLSVFFPTAAWITEVSLPRTWPYYISFVSFWVLLAGLLSGQSERTNLDLAFPKRLQRLPVRTSVLVAVWSAYSTVIIVGYWLFYYWIVNRWLDTLPPVNVLFGEVEVPPTPPRVIFLVTLRNVAIYFAIQSLAWAPGRKAALQVFTPVVFFIGALYLFFDIIEWPYGIIVVYAAAIVICALVSWAEAAADRASLGGGGFRNPLDKGRKPARPAKDFGSSKAAQRWFEWRRTGYLYPLLVACLAAPLIGKILITWIMEWGVATFVTKKPSIVATEELSGLFLIAITAAWVAGILAFTIKYRDRLSGDATFWLRRPMETSELAAIRVRTTLNGQVATIAILALLTILLVSLGRQLGDIEHVYGVVPQNHTVRTVALVAPLALLGFVVTTWIFQSLAPLMTLALVATISIATWRPHEAKGVGKVLYEWSLNGVSIVILLVTVAILLRAWRKGYVAATTLFLMTCAWPVVAASIHAMRWWVTAVTPSWTEASLPNASETLNLLAVAALAFIPLLTAALAVNKQREG